MGSFAAKVSRDPKMLHPIAISTVVLVLSRLIVAGGLMVLVATITRRR